MPVTTTTIDRLQELFGDTYRIERELGGGGMSRLFLATERSLNRQVVIKVLAPELASEVSAARFQQEIEVTAHLHHPHILPVLAAGRAGPEPGAAGAASGELGSSRILYYITPYVAGESLRHRLEQGGALSVAATVRILGEVADALAYAHGRGVTHRDVKPANILLLGEHAVLADFGVARALGAAAGGARTEDDPNGPSRLTDVGLTVGTPGYMSPEQAAGELNLDPRSDLYALAVVGYEMLAGRPPFTGPTARAVLAAHLSEPPRPVEELRPDTPPAVAAALARALAKDPADRFQTAAEFRDALVAGGEPARRQRIVRHAPRSRRWLAAAGAVAVAALATGTVLYRRSNAEVALDANLLAVAPFDVLDSGHALWREGIVDVLSANLDGAGPIRAVSPTVVIRRWTGRADGESATRLGRATGARLAVFGRMVPAGGDSLRVTATVWDVAARRSLGEIELRDDATHMDRLTDSLAVRVLRELGQTRAIGAVRSASIGSASLVAIKAYLQGEQQYRRSNWDSAAVYYQRAIAADTTFAPAMRRLSNALVWKPGSGEQNSAAYRWAVRAGAHNRGLAPRESLLVVADSIMGTLLGGMKEDTTPPFALGRRLFATLDTLTRRFPNDPEAWFKLGDARTHFFPLAEGSEGPATALAAFRRSIALDSAFAPAYIHAIDFAIREQDEAGARRYVRNYLALGPADLQGRSAALVSSVIDAPGGATLPDTVLAQQDPLVLSFAGSALLHWMDPAESAVRVARTLYAQRGSGRLPAGLEKEIPAVLASVLAYRGHLREARAYVDSSTAPALLPEMALLGTFPADSMRLFMQERLTDARPRRLGVALRWLAERGDTATLAAVVRRFERAESPSSTYLLTARAYRALAASDTSGALRHFAAMRDSVCGLTCWGARLTQAQLLAAQRQDQAAARLLSADYPNATPMRGIWMLERARVAERLGDKSTAIEGYSFVSRAWANADPQLQPAVSEARVALKRLGGAA